MYTSLKAYQIIIALLKKYGIKHCVLSAGSRNLPFVHSVEEDSYFKCYSVVDERSAGYFALGVAQEINEPVVISCTSSTATCNYWAPIAEAFYQSTPIIILTSDRDPAMLGQWEDQMIDQVGMYDRHVRKSVNLPRDIINQDDFIYCQRLVNEAFLELNHRGKGPVHINIPTKDYNTDFSTKELPKVVKFDRLGIEDSTERWIEKVHKLNRTNRILITCGQNFLVSNKLKSEIQKFFENFNVAISAEYMSNMDGIDVINTSVCMERRFISLKKFEKIIPDIIISFGGNIMSDIKEMLRKFPGRFEHWSIQENGRVVDMYKSLTTIYECSPERFFLNCNKLNNKESKNNLKYYNLLKSYTDMIVYPEFEFSNVYAIKHVVENILPHSILHLSINNAIRITNFFKISPGIKVYANIGTHGIDGCMSSFLGQAAVTENNSYLIIGDLSFFYDMNALRINHIGNNVRILLLNNHGGEEFYFNGIWINESSDLHTSARHNSKAEGWVKECGFKYLKATDKESYSEAINEFMVKQGNVPILLEVFTEMKTDSDVIHSFFDLSKSQDTDVVTVTKKFIKSVMAKNK